MSEQRSFNRTETLRLKIAAYQPPSEHSKGSGDTQPVLETGGRPGQTTEQLFDELYESVYDAVFITQTDGTILRQNEQARWHFGIPDDALPSTNILELILGANADHLSSVRQRLQQQGRVWIEAYCVGQGEHAFPAEITANLIHYTGRAEGEVCFFIRDTTAQMKAEEELANERYLMSQLMEQSNDRIYFKDCEGKFLRVSRQWLKSVGLSHPDEAIGRSEADFFDQDHVHEAEIDDRQIIETGKPILNKAERLRRDDTREGPTWLSTNKGPLISVDGSIVGTFGVSRDITTQKQYEQTLSEQNVLMETDLRVAREIQQAFLEHEVPTFPPSVPKEASAIQFWSYYLPSGAIGGDFFDINALNDRAASVLICDVMGHDVRAALIMASLHGLSEKMEAAAGNPGEFLTEVNSSMCAILERAGTLVFTSAFYMVLDAESGILSYANAGHSPPLYQKSDGVTTKPLGGTPESQAPALGLFRDTAYKSRQLELSPGDQITVFTDGLFEVHNTTGEPYGLDRLRSAVSNRGDAPAHTFFPALIDEIKAYSQNREFEDDVCLVNIEFSRCIK